MNTTLKRRPIAGVALVLGLLASTALGALAQSDTVVATVSGQSITEADVQMAVSELDQQFAQLTPEQQKIYSQNIAYGPANTQAVPLLDKAILKDMPTTPENIANQVQIDVSFWADNGEQLEQRFNSWAAK